MLLNGTHLLPDLTGALIWPRHRLVVVSDPVADQTSRAAPQQAAEALRRLAPVLRKRQPAGILWLGTGLANMVATGSLPRREVDELGRVLQAHAWTWIGDDLPPNLPGQTLPSLTQDGLTLRQTGQAGNVLGEISATPSPIATLDGRNWPCFVMDGRRLILPAFGVGDHGVNVLSPPFQSLFRRPFSVLALAGGRIITRPRARLEDPSPAEAAPPQGGGKPAGQRIRLFGGPD